MPDLSTAGRSRQAAVAIAVVILAIVAGCGTGADTAISPEEPGPGPSSNGTAWETFHDFGRWVLLPDRQTIQIERASMRSSCADHRVVLLDESTDQWLIQFETRVAAEECPAVGCIDCSLELALDRPVPTEIEFVAVCDPNASITATTAPGGAQVTLHQPSDDTEAVVCSATPEPGDALPTTSVQPPRDHTVGDGE